jgi:prepilin peptidase CpaA
MDALTTIKFVAFLALLLVAASWDIKERRIPNTVTVTGLGAALLVGSFLEGGFPRFALAGAGIGLLVTFPLFALGAIGAGDAKFFTAVGAFLGPAALLPAALYGGLAGGVLAMIGAVRRGVILPVLLGTKNLVVYLFTLGRHGERLALDSPGVAKIPYGVAIAAGALASWFFPFLPGGSP